jgi:hypothetical protein
MQEMFKEMPSRALALGANSPQTRNLFSWLLYEVSASSRQERMSHVLQTSLLWGG